MLRPVLLLIWHVYKSVKQRVRESTASSKSEHHRPHIRSRNQLRTSCDPANNIARRRQQMNPSIIAQNLF